MCSQNLMGAAGKKIDVLAGATSTESLTTRGAMIIGRNYVMATS